MDALDKNEAWNLVQLLVGRKVVGRKWLFKKKLNEKGELEKYKSRLVEKRYSQVEGNDFGQKFSPIAKVTQVLFLLSIDASFDVEVENMDAKTSFLNGNLEK